MKEAIFVGVSSFTNLREPDMSSAQAFSSDVAFTPTVKSIQSRKGSRDGYASMEQRGSWRTGITPDLAQFIQSQISVFFATANSQGQPYIQHRGGPAGFLHVLDERTIAFADFAGNRQYITQGNLADNAKAYLFLIDYRTRQRVKLWGEARVVEGDADLMAKLMPPNYRARPEQVILFKVSAWDMNCPQHIPLRFDAAEVAAIVADRDKRIEELEAEIDRMRAGQLGR
jgi:predicted pyridoxine 5'-phosphate oxidase superfamily flavin-nucleotide-binding protein